ncbi:MAG: hypothetical protein HC927_11450, partial [Deltaproteobacteria bacterium]|nr:hypothetical protein [Deltaproteobacteria bacterium]
TLAQTDFDILSTSEHSFSRAAELFRASAAGSWLGCWQAFCEVEELVAEEPLAHTTSLLSHDELGFLVHERTTVDTGFGLESIDVQREYIHNLSEWLVGLPTQQTTHSIIAGETLARHESFSHDLQTGALASQTREPGDPELFLNIRYVHDAFGNVVQVAAQDGAGEVRKGTIVYDQRGRFPERFVDALGHESQLAWHGGLSLPHTATDPNGIRQLVDVDGFGRTTGVRVYAGQAPRGDAATVEYLPGPDGEGMEIRSAVAGHGRRSTIHDRLARIVEQRWQGPDGQFRHRVIRHDARGRVESITLPSLLGQAPAGEERWHHDVLDRPTLHRLADGTFERWIHDGLTIQHHDFSGERSQSIHDGAGRLIESRQAVGTVDEERICFDHGHFSFLLQVRPDCLDTALDVLAPGEAPARIKRFEYDRLGRLLESDNPSEGTRLYVWNGFGELVEELDANDNFIEYEYDLSGRPTARVDDDGITTWTWDLAGIGLLAQSESPDGIVDEYAYDAFGRVTHQTRTLGDEDFTASFVYDGLDRIAQIHYPHADNLPPFAVRHIYTVTGELAEVREHATNATLWVAEQFDEEGRITRERFGNQLATEYAYDPLLGDLRRIRTLGDQPSPLQDLHYTWNAAGTLASREDARLHQIEQFTYDHRHRLAHVHSARGDSVYERFFAYDSLGNLVHATDVGDYDYDERGRLSFANTATHTWDDNGNLAWRSRPEGDHAFSWTSFDKLRRLAPADAAPTLYEYDAGQRRARRHDLEAQLETIYAFDLYERDRETTDEGFSETHRYHVHGRDRIVAEVVHELGPDLVLNESIRYIHPDHLGSPDLISDADGEVIQRLSFDAWGRARDPEDWTAHDDFTPELLVDRGYTGHRARHDAGLVDMGGRLYDPTLGRMVNADPFVVDFTSNQGWNRYAYVLNNPISLTDPTGYAPAPGEHDNPGDFDYEDLPTESGQPWQVGVGHDDPNNFIVRPKAGSQGDSGPEADNRPEIEPIVVSATPPIAADGAEEQPGDDTSSATEDILLGALDGAGNVAVVVMKNRNPAFAVAAALGGSNPGGRIRSFLGHMSGSASFSREPTASPYHVSMIVAETIASAPRRCRRDRQGRRA